jgi:hypothetical protein
MVLDVLRLLAKGLDAAKEAGKKLLSGMPLALWRRGLDDSPAQALPVSCRGCAPTIGVAACLSIYSNRLVPALDAAASDPETGEITPLPERRVRPGFASGLRTRWRSVTKGMKKTSYRGYRFPPEIKQQAIWLYLRFTLSLRDVEDLLAERGILVLRDRSAPTTLISARTHRAFRALAMNMWREAVAVV